MMDLFSYLPNMNTDHLSVEVNSDGFPFQADQFSTTIDMDFNSFLDSDFDLNDIYVAGVCDSMDLVESITQPVELNEFDKYLGPSLLPNPKCEIEQNLLALNNLPVYANGVPQRSLKQSHKIEIVNELEQTYRPRYKSDYFGQNGKQRKPRYVADRHGNHYITLKVPTGVQGKIRVDWLTVPTETGDRYSMPYRFQADNESVHINDCNPIFLDLAGDSSGTQKVYLVLIKSKQDTLKNLQPLQPFHPMQDVFGIIDKYNSDKTFKMTAKLLIQKYQLNKSQLAFTFCALSADGQSSIPEWDTTVYSTVLEEEGGDSPATKTVACPKCSCQILINDDIVIEQAISAVKRKSLPYKTEKPKTIKKQKSACEMLYAFN